VCALSQPSHTIASPKSGARHERVTHDSGPGAWSNAPQVGLDRRADRACDDHLRPLAERVEALLGRLTSLGSLLKSGSLNPAQLLTAAGAVSSLGVASSGVGAAIEEVAPPL
jgi:hypothetical protein